MSDTPAISGAAISGAAISTAAIKPSTVATAPAYPPRPSYEEFIKENVAKVGEKGSDPFPMVEKAWDVFAGKGIRTVFVSIGSSASPLADLEIAESLGCPVHVLPLHASEKAVWAEVATVLKDRKRDASASSFTEFVDTKWILPKNLRILESIPWWENGTLDISGATISAQKVDAFLGPICSAMKLKDGAKRLDILKIDTSSVASGLEIPILNAVISAGYRPSVILVKWSKMPDTDLPTTLSAGHLQCSGYSLLDTRDNKFLYFFNDDNIYEICSWEAKTHINPIVHEIVKSTSRRH